MAKEETLEERMRRKMAQEKRAKKHRKKAKKVKKMATNKQDDMELRLRERINKEQPMFSLGSPGRFTQAIPNSSPSPRFSKKPMIGEELLHCFDVYIGKTGQLIFKFYENPPDDATKDDPWIEMVLKEATAVLEGFKEYAEDLLGDDYVKMMNVARKKAKKKVIAPITQEQRDAKIQASEEFDHYGSW